MSSSAFTPSTTTVTNNVPVNVPVVTAWQDYSLTIGATTTAPTKGTIVFDKASWRRVGDSIEIRYNYAQSTAGTAGSGTYLFPIPSGLTIDTSKVNLSTSASSSAKVGSGSSSLTNPANNNYELKVIPYNSSNLAVTVSTGTTTPAFIGSANLALSDIDRCYNFFATVPISQWSSGTTTLATRAVEEYAWNSSTSTTSDTTSFGNGPDGVNIRAFAPSGNNSIEKRVRFQTPIQATDRISLEFNSGAGWALASDISGGQTTNDAGNVSYGQVIRPVSGSTTDFSVFFNSANAGQTLWSGLTSWKWRVRKVSSGAQVGYPVSARNIVGDTSGSVVPVGMLGETTTIANATSTSVPSGTVNITGLTQTLQSGTWLLIAEGQVSVVSPASGMTSGQTAYMDIRIQNTTDSTTTAAISNVAYLRANSATTTNGGSGGFNLTSVVTLTSQKSFQVQGTYQSSITGGTTQTFQSGKFYAVRIA